MAYCTCRLVKLWLTGYVGQSYRPVLLTVYEQILLKFYILLSMYNQTNTKQAFRRHLAPKNGDNLTQTMETTSLKNEADVTQNMKPTSPKFFRRHHTTNEDTN